MSKGILHEYFFYQEKYTKIYGNTVLCVFRSGEFYEIYATNTRGYDLTKVSDVTNLVKTRKDKKMEVSEKNPYLMGFHYLSLQKFLKILVDNHFTVVVVDQITPAPNPKRAVTGIYSADTNINDNDSTDSNNIVSIYIEDEKQLNGAYLSCIGLSSVDLTTGECSVYEVFSSLIDDKYALDEAYRFIIAYNPKEIIISRKELENTSMKKEQLLSYLEIENKNVHYITNNGLNKSFGKVSYQNEFFGKIYKDRGMMTPIEHIDMEKMQYARMSLIILFDFVYKHNETFISNLDKPSIFTNNKHLILGNNAIYQLNILETNSLDCASTKFRSLFDVINHTSTAMGRRFMKQTICQPLNQIDELQSRYDCTEEMINDNLYLAIEEHLNCILDIERLGRKVFLGVIHPYEFANLIESFNQIDTIYKMISVTKYNKVYRPDEKLIGQVKEFLTSCNKTFDIAELKKQNLNDITSSFFKKGVYSQIDDLNDNVVNNIQILENVCKVLSTYIDDNNKFKKKNNIETEHKEDNGAIKLKKNDRDGYYLCLTKRRSDMLKEAIKNLKTIKISDTLSIDPNKLVFREAIANKAGKYTDTKIFFTDLNNKSDDVINLKEKLIAIVKKKYVELLVLYGSKYKDMFRQISQFIAKVDFIKSNARTAKLYNYCKPELFENKDNGFIDATNMRHPIIERIRTDIEYVPHSIHLGKSGFEGVERMDGMLLYGLNSAGKCFSPDTDIMMHSGIIKKAKNIIKGDKLMGDDSMPRTVLGTTVGKGQMYKIVPTKGEPFIVNGPHILCLKSSGYKYMTFQTKENRYKVIWFNQQHNMQHKSFTIKNKSGSNKGIYGDRQVYNTKEDAEKAAKKFLDNTQTDEGDIIEVSVDDYFKKPAYWKYNYYLYRVGIEFEEKEVSIDPYILGYWLGDGTNTKPGITTENPEVVDCFKKYAEKIGLKLHQGKNSEMTRHELHYNITTGTKEGGKYRNNFLNNLRALNVMSNKHIPDNYKFNSRENRLKILAGIIDSDGSNSNDYGFDICLKDKKLLEDIIYIARSLGFACYLSECYKTCTNAAGGPKKGKYYRTYIGGELLKDVPLLIKYKIPEKSDIKERNWNMITSFKIHKLKVDQYVGFETDGNKRFLLGDFTVTHNSSMQKAVGLSLIMAQCGMYVPAEKYRFAPYDAVFARITGNDNIFKGLSQFGLEMCELRAILKRNSPKTLVIGDEVCRGTEHVSANCIVATTLINLAKSGCSFIFATHLHEIANMERIKNLKNVKTFHLSVEYDTKTDSLIFDRTLKPGSGSSVYGLTVAKYIIKDDQFMKMAQEIMNELMDKPNELLSDKTSKYNGNLYVDCCQICGKQNSESNEHTGFLDTHHINFQSNCNEDGFVIGKSYLPMNNKSNLIVLCKTCHYKVHHNELQINGYKDTSNGRLIDYKFIDKVIDKITDDSDEYVVGKPKKKIVKKVANKNIMVSNK